MAILRPFRGILYDPSRVDLSRVVAPPYDVISPADQRRFYAEDPHNVVRLIAGEVQSTDSAEDNKYVRAARFFDDWLREGILRRDPEPSLHVYRHDFVDPVTGEPRVRQGLLGVVELEPFGRGILPHERTHARAKADRLSLTRAVQANLSPIFSMFQDPNHEAREVVQPIMRERPRLSIDGDDGEHHRVWSVTDRHAIQRLGRVLAASRLYVADGHHRYETALNFQHKMRAEHPDAPSDAAFNFVLMLLVEVEDPGLTILPTHRIVHDLPNFDPEQLLRGVQQRFRTSTYQDVAGLLEAMLAPTDEHRIGMALDGHWLTIDIERSPGADPVSGLDVSVLHREILQGVLGLADAELEEERYLSYSRDVETVLDRVAGKSAQAAFLLRPPAVADVVAVASAGQVMPQKSTYFYPKPASGIVFNPLDPAIRIPAV